MKFFTIKDFISYNNPCFSCNNQKILKIVSSPIKENIVGGGVLLNPTISSTFLEVDLKITYLYSLKLKISHTSNKIIISNIDDLTKYLEQHTLYFVSRCNCCGTRISSNILTFDLTKSFVKPLSIESEIICVKEGESFFILKSYFAQNKSNLIINKKDSDPIELSLPLYPLLKFKNRDHFLSKMKMLALFS